jgi:hypothetical protein
MPEFRDIEDSYAPALIPRRTKPDQPRDELAGIR